jgi:integrase
MAGHIQDRWYKAENINGKSVKVKTDRHGTGMRYRARYVGPDGTEKSKSFPDRQKRQAETWLANVEADMSRGQYIDHSAGRITLQQYGEKWLASWTGDPATFIGTDQRLRLHVFPHIGHYPLSAISPEHLREWFRTLDDGDLSVGYQNVIFANLTTLLNAAVEDKRITANPCRASSVKAPRVPPRKVKPWSEDRVFAVQAALAERYRAMVDLAGGCGFRQGEVLGLAVDEVDAVNGVVRVVRQVKLLRNRPIFALPKYSKVRDVPLPDSVAESVADHITRCPPVEVTLPWGDLDGPPLTVSLIFSRPTGREVNRHDFNRYAWHPALEAAGVATGRENGMHALRHFYASMLLDAGENIRALSEYLGHHDPAFTLRTYTHLMPSSEKRTKTAVDAVLARKPHGPQTAHEKA